MYESLSDVLVIVEGLRKKEENFLISLLSLYIYIHLSSDSMFVLMTSLKKAWIVTADAA